MALRAGEIELLFTANVDQIDKAEKQVKQVGKTVEGNPIKIDADTSDVLAGMDRVEGEVKRLVSADTVVKLDAEISRAETNIERTKARIEDLQVKADAGLDVTADVKRAEAALSKAERSLKGLTEARAKIDVDADTSEALAALQEVAAEKRVVSADVVAKVDADITYAQRNVTKIRAELEVLAAQEATPQVLVDVSKAESRLEAAEKKLRGLEGARANMEVDADTSGAEAELKKLPDVAKGAGENSGRSFAGSLDSATRGAGEKVGAVVGGEVESTLVDALSAIPVAGGIILAGVAIGKAITGAINDGLAVEKNQDRLQALTGITEADALRLSRAAGEAYANNFGESIESNMDTTRLALQFRILDPNATTRDAQLVVQGLSGIADVLGEDVRPVAQAVTQLISTGLAKNATQAYDLIAAGARNGVNRNEDLLDTLTEYPSLFQRLGLSGEEALGLVSQSMQAGARNSDLAADALKEFQIRATDASTASAAGFEALGLNAEEMTAKIARGGTDARDGLDAVLTKLRETEDPVVRNAAAVALFGTQAEDLGEALFAMDLSSAVEQLGGVTGAAQKMFDTLSDNDASKIEQAQRSIETAAEGIKGALAQAFADPLAEGAEWISQNRGPVLQFFSDLVNGAIDFGITAAEAFGSFVSGPLADMVDGLKHVIKFINPFADTSDLESFINGMRDFESTTDDVADGLESMRKPFNVFMDGQVALGYVSDAALRTADAVSKVGYAAEGSASLMDQFKVAQDGSVSASGELQSQLEASAAALQAEYDAAVAAGESQENLQGRYDTTSAALMNQLTAMGLTQEQAQSLINTVLKTPTDAYTRYSSNAEAQAAVVNNLTQKVVQMPDGSFVIVANTGSAQATVNDFVLKNSQRVISIAIQGIQTATGRAYGGPIWGPGGPRDDVIPIMASNGEHMLPADEVAMAGGHAGVYRIRQAIRQGLRLADGGPVAIDDRTWRMPSTTSVPAAAAAQPAVVQGASRRPVNVVQHIYTTATDGVLIARESGQEIERGLGSV